MVASLEKTWAKSAYSDGRETLGFVFSVVMASSVAVVSLVMVSSVAVMSLATNREFGRKCL